MSNDRIFRVSATSDDWGDDMLSQTLIIFLADCEDGVAPGHSKGTRDMIMSDLNVAVHAAARAIACPQYVEILMALASTLDATIERCLAKGWIEVVMPLVHK